MRITYTIITPVTRPLPPRPGSLPNRRHDGARLRHDRRDHAVLVRVHRRAQPGGQDCHYLQTVLGTALLAGYLLHSL